MSIFLCYDLKGIQQYIFQVPRLKCCIGGSRQIDNFDRKEVVDLAKQLGIDLIYSGGGKGAFVCSSEDDLQNLKRELVKKAREFGLTIRFGYSDVYSTAAREIRETFCWQPESLDGQPCSESGLYPTTEGVHPLIQKRIAIASQHGKESPVEREFLEELRKEFKNEKFEFFYNPDPDDRDGYDTACALGSRNRWAVVRMDGNDMGLQFLEFQKRHPETNAKEWREWLPKMSRSLDECTRDAALEGMKAVVQEYVKSNHNDVLPLRPLIIGGDDVSVLVHCSYAVLFVKTVMEKFTEFSKRSKELWVGTNGALSISGGILYAPCKFPLHSALDYAEELLASAKTHGRELKKQKKDTSGCSPACFDWESITEGLLDSPAARRQREFIFTEYVDGKEKKVELTSRPYSLEEFEKLEPMYRKIRGTSLESSQNELDINASELGIPATIQYQIHPALYAPKDRRCAFYARLGKNYRWLYDYLKEPIPGVEEEYGKGWSVDGNIQKTSIIDILLRIQEEVRMEKPTIAMSGEEN